MIEIKYKENINAWNRPLATVRDVCVSHNHLDARMQPIRMGNGSIGAVDAFYYKYIYVEYV